MPLNMDALRKAFENGENVYESFKANMSNAFTPNESDLALERQMMTRMGASQDDAYGAQIDGSVFNPDKQHEKSLAQKLNDTLLTFSGNVAAGSGARNFKKMQSLGQAVEGAADKMPSLSDNPNFKKWFGESEKGDPLTVYHGTANDFTEFKKPSRRDRGNAFDRDSAAGMFFSSDPKSADYFAFTKGMENKKRQAFGSPIGSNIMPAHLNIQNPMVHDFNGATKSPDLILDLAKRAKKQGHDGLVLKNVYDSPGAGAGDIFITFEPTQIKSAIGNRGTFDPNDSNILRSGGNPSGMIERDIEREIENRKRGRK
jgi:hypothetical protein